jgi:hypothetical protein
MYPGVVQYSIEWAGGGFGRFLSNSAHTIEAAFTGESVPTERLPIVRQFIGETNGQGEASRYYEMRQDIQDHRNRYNNAKKAAALDPSNEQARDTLDREATFLGVTDKPGKKASWKKSAVDAFTQADDAIKELRQEKQALRGDTTMTTLQRFRRSQEIDSEIEAIQRSARGLYRSKAAP